MDGETLGTFVGSSRSTLGPDAILDRLCRFMSDLNAISCRSGVVLLDMLRRAFQAPQSGQHPSMVM